MREFESPARSLGDLSPEVVGRLLAASADVALVIDDKGVLRLVDEKVDVTNHGTDLLAAIAKLRG